MSGDVQPRKRKEKRRKKDNLGVEEPRGTAAIFGEGDVLMHSHHEHGTGGHWCAKIIFFSLLAVLVTLIGLIILENRGLSELEANAVESRYSGVLEGWIEDAPGDDHHDEHTLELKHHRYEDGDDDHELSESEHDDEEENSIFEDDEHGDEKEHENDEEPQDNEEREDDDDDEEHEDDDDEELDNDEEYEDDDNDHDDKDTTENVLEIDDQDDDSASDEQNVEDDNEDDDTMEYNKYYKYNEQDDEVEYDENLESSDSREEENEIKSKENDEGYDDNESNEIIEDNDDNIINYEENIENVSNENPEQNEDEEDFDEEIERIEEELVDEAEEAISSEASNNENDLNNNKKATEKYIQEIQEEENTLESEEVTEPIVEQITAPSGKPFIELEDEQFTEKPSDTLAEEEEYEKRQEQIRLEKEESSSQMWLKLTVGGALLVATHAVIRRFTAPRDIPEAEDNTTREDDPTLIDRRMTLIPKESDPLLPQENFGPIQVEPGETVVKHLKMFQPNTIYKQEEEQIGKNEELARKQEVTSPRKDILDQELYSDDDEEVDEDVDVEIEAKEYSKDTETKVEKDADESEMEEVPDDVEIIDDEQIDEEIEEEDEDEEEISDVDDAELLSRLEAKYGRLPEPERPGYKHKDGGNNLEDEWPGEPSEQFWRQQLDIAEQEIRQDWLD